LSVNDCINPVFRLIELEQVSMDWQENRGDGQKARHQRFGQYYMNTVLPDYAWPDVFHEVDPIKAFEKIMERILKDPKFPESLRKEQV